jgi:acyl carrier protein phosphodiesterase
MNYLSHYYLDRIENSCHHNLGLVLPDFMAGVNRRWKPTLHPQAKLQQDCEKQMWLGIEKHVSADKVFHSSEFFKENTTFIRQQLELHKEHFDGIRLFFLAHIMLELMLDRLILKKSVEVGHNFYNQLAEVPRPELVSSLQKAVQPDFGRFFEFFDRFLESRWIFEYVQDDKLTYALNRIMGRGGQAELLATSHQPLVEVIAVVEDKLQKEYQDFFGWMKASG